jgi:cyanophycinase
MKRKFKYVCFLLLCAAWLNVNAQSKVTAQSKVSAQKENTVESKIKAKGSLFIIGGGKRSDALIGELLATAKLSAKDYIIVLPMASGIPDTSFNDFHVQLRLHTNLPIRNFDFNKHDTKDPKWVDSVAGAKLIYILGGDQSRFMKAVLNTPVYAAIHKAYQSGSTIAGTSAGAAVMSKFMITGVQLKDSKYRETFDKLWDQNIEFSEGLGLLEHTIIDQHFLKRSRYNRIISALAAKPGYMGVGIDEGTAIIVNGNKATVAGDSQVLRFVSPERAQTAGELLKFKHINLGIYTAGDVIDILP